MSGYETRRVAREDVASDYGRRLIVQCDRPGCDHAVLMEPGAVFGSGRSWPAEGRSSRFRCRCGHRETRLTYTRNASQANGLLTPAVIRLWF